MSRRNGWQKGRASSRQKFSLGKTQGKQGVARNVGCTWQGVQEPGTDSIQVVSWRRGPGARSGSRSGETSGKGGRD